MGFNPLYTPYDTCPACGQKMRPPPPRKCDICGTACGDSGRCDFCRWAVEKLEYLLEHYEGFLLVADRLAAAGTWQLNRR